MNQKLLPLLFFAVLSVAFLAPILNNISNWGVYDWDQHFFYNAAPRMSMIDFGQFPLWNPYYCGGNPLLANPQSGFFSPFFLFVLLFGVVPGLKLQALLYLFLGLLGTFLVSKRLGNGSIASALAAVVFMLGSWFAARLVVGHTTFFPFALMPWAFLFLLLSFRQLKYAMAAAFTLAVMFLSGGIYPFYASVLLLGLYAALTAVEGRHPRNLAIFVLILLIAFAFVAVKALPVLEFTSGVVPEKDVQLNSFAIVAKSFFLPFQSIEANDVATGRDSVPESPEKYYATLKGEIPWGWHEYSAYIGILAFLLAAASFINYRKNWKLLATGLFFFVLLLGDSSPIPLWGVLRHLPFFSSLHGPSRFAISFVFIIALLAASSLSTIKPLNRRKFSLAIAALVTAELLFVSFPLLLNAFPLAPPQNLQAQNEQYIQMFSSAPYISQYPNVLQGIATVNCYERLHLGIRAVPQFVDGEPYPGFIGNAYIAETNRTFDFSYFSPNKIKVAISPPVNETSTLVVNENYYKGWRSSNGRIKSYNGLLAAEITPADTEVEFSYAPKSFVIGLLITLASLTAAAVAFFRPKLVRRLIFQEQS